MASRARRAGVAFAATLTATLAPAARHAVAQTPPASRPGGGGNEPADPYAAPAPPSPQPGPEAKPAPGPAPGSGPNSNLGSDDDIDDQVAQALYRRGMQLYQRGSTADAKKLFIESLERSPKGSVSDEALRMLRAANQRLGIANQDDGRPGLPGQETVLEPYGARSGGGGASDEGPIDPYGAAAAAEPRPLDQVVGEGNEGKTTSGGPPDEPAEAVGSKFGRRVVIGWSGGVGLLAGLALAGPENDSGDFSGGAAVAGVVGAAAGVGLSYWLTEGAPLTDAQSTAIASAATWGATMAGLLGDATTGTDSEPNDVWKYLAAGGMVGLGAGVLVATKVRPSEGDIALTNSLAAYGAALGLGIAAGIDPPHSEAFSLNALFGASAGIAAGVLLAPRLEVSRKRTLFLDLGAAAGAAVSWGIIYPIMADGTTNSDEQVAGWLSTVSLSAGVVLAWYLTSDMDKRAEPLAAARPLRGAGRGLPAPPALARREADGRWQLGVPFLRPFSNPALAPPGGASALGLDLLSGRF